ncbi:MAG: hypothetical protein HQL60_02625 [Magnetococcales bacterium]|nr:hypothetical protein [Magnetococcales bacterium]
MSITIDLMENDLFRPLLLKGIQDGKMEGIKEGQIDILLSQAQYRFGQLPKKVLKNQQSRHS